MSSTILMAIVLVVMWLVVLVPMFVRRGDERAELRSMDRFATAMRVLSRRAPSSGGVAGRRRYATAPPAPYADGASPVRTAARDRMLRRRRRTLAVLACHRRARRSRPRWRSAPGSGWPRCRPTLLLGRVRRLAARPGPPRARAAQPPGRAVRRGGHPAPARARGPPPGPDRRGRSRPRPPPAASDRSWRPVPVPAPTYVTAPVVRRRTETHDRPGRRRPDVRRPRAAGGRLSTGRRAVNE